MAKNFKMTDNSAKAISAINKQIEKGLTEASMLVKSEAQSLAPVDEGNLKRSIDYELENSDSEISSKVGAKAEHAPFVEKGTGLYAENDNGRKTPWVYRRPDGEYRTTTGMKPQPFLEPAFVNNKSRIQKIIKDNMKGVKF